MPEAAQLPRALADATAEQPRARSALVAALPAPSHAYLLHGPRGVGKRAAARAFAAELLAGGAPDPESARRRALADPSPHPDLVWVRPPGAQHLVEELRSDVIRAASLRPFEGERRVFVIEAAEAMKEESQNALLKTLEEPAPFAHLILVCSEPELLLPTIVSRCQPIPFAPLTADAIEKRLADSAQGTALEAVARLCGGDLELARLLLSDEGGELRARAEGAARATRRAEDTEAAWRPLLQSAEQAGEQAGARAEQELVEVVGKKGSGKLPRDATDQVRRVERRARTEALDLGLGLCCAWFRDLAAVAEGAPELALNRDRLEALSADAEGIAPQRAREAVELVLDTRRRLLINVSEELALDALWYRLEDTLSA
ncbi:MAG: DNA polymerase III subunit [Solirubrobacterales bacterium]